MTGAEPCPECHQPVTRVNVNEQTRRVVSYGYGGRHVLDEPTGYTIWTFWPCGHRMLVGAPSPYAIVGADGLMPLPSAPLPRHRPTGTGWPA